MKLTYLLIPLLLLFCVSIVLADTETITVELDSLSEVYSGELTTNGATDDHNATTMRCRDKASASEQYRMYIQCNLTAIDDNATINWVELDWNITASDWTTGDLMKIFACNCTPYTSNGSTIWNSYTNPKF